MTTVNMSTRINAGWLPQSKGEEHHIARLSIAYSRMPDVYAIDPLLLALAISPQDIVDLTTSNGPAFESTLYCGIKTAYKNILLRQRKALGFFESFWRDTEGILWREVHIRISDYGEWAISKPQHITTDISYEQASHATKNRF